MIAMPTYTFRCPKCKHKFTDIFPMSQSSGEDVICPQCQNNGLKRVYEGSFSIGKNVSSSCPTGVCPLPKR